MYPFSQLTCHFLVQVDEDAIEEDNDAQYRWRDEELSVDTQPGEVQANLLPKVLPFKLEATHEDFLTFL